MSSVLTKLKVTSLVDTLSQVKANEIKITLMSFLMVFILMASYFVLRPVRDALASDWSDTEVSMLWNLQFFISVAIVSLYGFTINKIRFKYIIPSIYALFAASFVAFYCLIPLFSSTVLVEKAFYVWVSAFSLFHLSVFWTLMSDTFSEQQSVRLFPIIAAGASAGAIVGPAIPVFLGGMLEQRHFMLIAAIGLLCVVPLTLYIIHLKHNQIKPCHSRFSRQDVLLGKGWLSGFKALWSNSKLQGIAAFILLYVFISSFIYFEQKQLLASYSRSERTQILASIDWIVNIITFVMAFFISGRLVKKIGLGKGLALLPILLTIGFVLLAFVPSVTLLLIIQIVRRAGNYSLTRPAREILFTKVSVDERFKAKPVIDVAVYRGGDAVSGSLFALFTDGLGLGLLMISLLGAGIASVWAGLGRYFGF